MKILPVRNNITKTIQSKSTKVIQKIPRKVTVDNLPSVAGTIGFLTPLPLGSVAFYALGKCAQIVIRKFKQETNKNITNKNKNDN